MLLSDIALGKPAKQSSTYKNDEAKGAVDGNRSTYFDVGSCSHTAKGDINPWWIVDLQAVYYIKTVRILNRKDYAFRLQHVTVTVGVTEPVVNTLCGFFPGPGTSELLVVIDCPTLPQGRFVKISMLTSILLFVKLTCLAQASYDNCYDS